jgi:hypothetical protein
MIGAYFAGAAVLTLLDSQAWRLLVLSFKHCFHIELTNPSKIPPPSVATLGKTFHGRSESELSLSSLVISSGCMPGKVRL